MACSCRRQPYSALLVELRDVAIKYDIQGINLPINTFKSIVCCAATVDYQCGRLNQDQYYDRLVKDFGHSREEIESMFAIVRKSVSVDSATMDMLSRMKARFQGQVKIHAVTNMSREDFTWARGLPLDWKIFDQIFVSGEMGMRKPELRFYQHIVDNVGVHPDEVILIDEDTDNRLAAMSLGMQGVPAVLATAGQTIVNMVEGNAVRRGWDFLRAKAKTFRSVTSTGTSINENFAQLLILELTGDE